MQINTTPIHTGGDAALHRVPILSDNYTWILVNTSSGKTAVIDPGESKPVIAYCQAAGLTPTEIINTHHHKDHIGGNGRVCKKFSAPLIAPAGETARIPHIDQTVADGDTIEIAGFPTQVFATPGHTTGHVAFYLPDCFGDASLAFVGDTLFSLGCGRVSEGTMAEMWQSLSRVRALPDNTLICAGHEYTLGNANYGLSLGWDNLYLKKAAAEIKQKRGKNQPTLPFWLGDDKRANPFLNCDDGGLAQALAMQTSDAVAVFTALRKGKDNFKG